MAVVFTLTYTLTHTTMLAATTGDLRAGTRAELSLSAPGLGGLPDDLAVATRAIPGVRAAAPVATTTVVWPYPMLGDTEIDTTSAVILTPAAPAVLDLDVRAGNLADLTGNTIAVDAGAARLRNAAVGRQVSLILGDGARVIRTDGTETAQHNLAALVASRPGLVLSDDSAGPSPSGMDAIPPELWINVAVLGVLLGYLLLGIANKLIATTAGRRTELAALQLIGATPRQIRSMMRQEAALICVIAFGTGVLLSVIPLLLLAIGILHRPWPAGPVWLLPTVAVVVAAIAFLAIELPTRHALRTAPADALTD